MSASTDEILKHLYAGEKLRLTFQSAEAREAFRVALYKKKKIQDDALTTLLEEERQVLAFEIYNHSDTGEICADLRLRPPKIAPIYFTILTD